MRERILGLAATVAAVALLAALLAGDAAAKAAAVLAAVAAPPLLIALARGGDAPVRRTVALMLALVLAAGAAGVLALTGTPAGDGGLPAATRWMLVVLCALPFAVASIGFARAHRAPPR